MNVSPPYFARDVRMIMSLEKVARLANDDIARAVEVVAQEFVASGGYGSFHMHLASNETILRAFRSTVSEMTGEARRFNKEMVREHLDSLLSGIIDSVLAERRVRLFSANAAADDSTALCASLHHDMKRLKDIAVRKFAVM